MEKGAVVQQGNFEQLKQEGGVFARVYKRCLEQVVG
jgi:ABC-type multidrug transport system fused ATPase/permease subunit